MSFVGGYEDGFFDWPVTSEGWEEYLKIINPDEWEDNDNEECIFSDSV